MTFDATVNPMAYENGKRVLLTLTLVMEDVAESFGTSY